MSEQSSSHYGVSQPTSISLLERARGNDREAWIRILQLYTPLIYHWCKLTGIRQDEMSDVCQEVFRAVVRKLVDFEHQQRVGSFRKWLKTITLNKITDDFRAKQRTGQATGGSTFQALKQIPFEEESDDEREVSMLYARAVELIRSEFNETQFQAFMLLVVEERPADQVADQLGVSRNVVYLAKSRILSRLRNEFAELVEPSSSER